LVDQEEGGGGRNLYKLKGYQIKIINQLGVQVFSTRITKPGYLINPSDWSGPGLYYLQLTDKSGRKIESRKILLQ
jgi:hypothetical protein